MSGTIIGTSILDCLSNLLGARNLAVHEIQKPAQTSDFKFARELVTNQPLPRIGPERLPVIVREVVPSVMLDNQLLAGKNVLITGAGRNIGRAIAQEMAKQGANIYFLEINPDYCANLEQELAQYLVTSKGFCVDITDQQKVDTLVED